MKGNKKKYVEKVVKYVQKKQSQKIQEDREKYEEHVQLQKKQIMGKQELNKSNKQQKVISEKGKTTVINVKVKFLREMGYNSLLDWLQNPNHVYIGRGMTHYVPGAEKSKWANPFKVDSYGRQECIQKYRKYLMGDQKMMSQLRQLKGKTLGCWCAPQGCHGDVLAQLTNNLKQE